MAVMSACGPAKIDLTTWDLDVARGSDPGTTALRDSIREAVTAVLRDTFERDPPDATLPFEYIDTDGLNGPPVTDPLAIRVGLPLGAEPDEFVHWQVSLSAMLDEVIHDNIRRAPPFFDDAERRMLQTIGNALRAEADKIDRIITNGREAP